MALSIRTGVGLVLGGFLAAACGGSGEDSPAAEQPGASGPTTIQPAVTGSSIPEEADDGNNDALGGATDGPVSGGPGGPVSGGPVTGGGGGDDLGNEGDSDIGTPPPSDADPNVCRTPVGVSGTPRTLEQAIILLNSLPRPTSMECFLQSLSRPLQLYMTSSGLSLQPSPGERSPRTFIVNEPLVMSIVFDGPGRGALELGLRTSRSRSVKTEILFPIERDVTQQNLFDEVRIGEATRCAACHTAEVQMANPEALAEEAFESDIIEPYSQLEVTVDSLRNERQICDPSSEPERCAMLSALFDFGEVATAPSGILFGF